eukprot:164571-Pleurochrysis_carterae.AAC.2
MAPSQCERHAPWHASQGVPACPSCVRSHARAHALQPCARHAVAAAQAGQMAARPVVAGPAGPCTPRRATWCDRLRGPLPAARGMGHARTMQGHDGLARLSARL